MDELELYQQMMSKDPSSQIFVYLAEALLENEMYKEAIETCVNGLRLRPHELRARVILGVSYLRTGELDRAESELLRAKEMLEINTVTYHALAELYDKKGDSESAERYRRLFEAIHPIEEKAIGSEREEKEGETATTEVPPEKTEMSTITMAQLYEEQGQLKEAAEVYRKIFDAFPETDGVEDKIAELERRVGETQVKRNLLSILESWQKNMKDQIDTIRASSPFGESAVDPEKMAAFIKKYVKESPSS
ncbi:MAG: tetratricopeptide repeat protein [Deltaproteobacteria bacterium]|nr:MAG: tetratricopeptide repeat protein [Deltaproteobacteria bacterium]